jgi:hypothetical protein
MVLPLAAMEVRVEQDRLRRCPQCGEFKGEALVDDVWQGRVYVPVSCLCGGIVCGNCRERVIHRPISNYFDEQAGTVWHVPWFAYMVACRRCRRRTRLGRHG